MKTPTCGTNSHARNSLRRGVSLAEVILALSIVGMIWATTVKHYRKPVRDARVNACRANQEILTTLAELYFDRTGKWPSSDLHELQRPHLTCPVDGSRYRFDLRTHSVIRHAHGSNVSENTSISVSYQVRKVNQ